MHFLINNFIFIYILHSKYVLAKKTKYQICLDGWCICPVGNCPVDICLRRICPDASKMSIHPIAI